MNYVRCVLFSLFICHLAVAQSAENNTEKQYNTTADDTRKLASTVREVTFDPQWKIVTIEDIFYIESPVLKKNILIDSSSIDPEIREIIKHKNLEIIVYYVGMTSGSEVHDVYHAVVYDHKRSEFVGNYPYKYVPRSENSLTSIIEQPKWNFAQNKLTIKDANLEFSKTILF